MQVDVWHECLTSHYGVWRSLMQLIMQSPVPVIGEAFRLKGMVTALGCKAVTMLSGCRGSLASFEHYVSYGIHLFASSSVLAFT